MRIIWIGFLILAILICGCIESDYNKDVKGNISITKNKTLDKTLDEDLDKDLDEDLDSSKITETFNKSNNESEAVDKSKINASINDSAAEKIENDTENITNTGLFNESINESINESNFASKPQVKIIKFSIYGLGGDNINAQELESKLQKDVEGIIYARVSGADETGVAVYDALKITKEDVIKEAGFTKSPGGVTTGFSIKIMGETNCTESNKDYRCCIGRECKIYGQ